MQGNATRSTLTIDDILIQAQMVANKVKVQTEIIEIQSRLISNLWSDLDNIDFHNEPSVRRTQEQDRMLNDINRLKEIIK